MSKEQLQKMALAAEIVGGAAVVITLIFLVLETKDNTRAIQAQTYLALTSEVNRVRETLLDSRVSGIFAEAVASQKVPESIGDALIYRQIFEEVFSTYESAYFARSKGVLDDAEWGRFQRAICRNMSNAAPIWGPNESELVFGQGIRGVLTEPFAEYVERECAWESMKDQLESQAEPEP